MKNRAFNFKRLKTILGAILFLVFCLYPALTRASIGCNILVYYNSSDSSGAAVTNLVNNVLIPAGANVTFIAVNSVGLCPPVSTETFPWAPTYNQVWDVRFVSSPIEHCPGTVKADYFDTCWQNAAVAYLEAGGSFFLQGENDGFPSRNMGDYAFLETCGVLTGSFVSCPDGTANSNDDDVAGFANVAGVGTFAGLTLPANNFGGTPNIDLVFPAASFANYTGVWNESGTSSEKAVALGWSGASQLPGLTGVNIGSLFLVWDQTGWTGAGTGNNYGVAANATNMDNFYAKIYTWFGGTACGPTSTPTATPSSTPSPTPTTTFTNTVTNTPISTFTLTNTPTINTPTITNTPTATYTSTPTPTATPNLYVWPNPFNPSTAVNGVLQAGYVASTASMSIYTITGELVTSYSGQNASSPKASIFYNNATGTINWTGRNSLNYLVSTGVYFYVIQNGGQTLLRGKLLVITGK